MLNRLLTILPLFIALHVSAQELYVPSSAILHVQKGATLTTGGELLNEGQLNNNGEVALFGDLTNVGTFNTLAGGMTFLGTNDQLIADQNLTVERLTVNKIGLVTFRGQAITVTSSDDNDDSGDPELNFINGVLTTESSTSFIVESDAQINHEMGSTSYFQGTIISRGTSNRIFPVGDGGFYGLLELFDMQAVSPEIGVSLIHQNPDPPVPGPDLIGVSGENTWVVDLLSGSLDSSRIRIEYVAEDLSGFEIENDISATTISPVVAQADSVTGPFRSLGVEELFGVDPDSTMGVLLAEEYAGFGELGPKYFAIAKAPLINPSSPAYFPNVFSPSDPDPINQTYKVFGVNVAEEPFLIQIYNRFSILVYETDSFTEANEVGWDGTDTSGSELPTGVYYYSCRYKNRDNIEGDFRTKTGSLLLMR